MAESNGGALTIEELAQRTGMTVRNIRAHQSRGLLPPPEVRARTGYYGPEHVARLQLISEMQGDGYNLTAIKRLLEGAQRSGEEVLGFARTLMAPFEDEQPEIVDAEELAARWGDIADPKLLRRLEKLGLLLPLGEGRYELSSPTLTRAGREVRDLGVPMDEVVGLAEHIQRHSESVARSFIALFLERVWKPFDEAGRPDEQWPEVREAVERLRPLASETLLAVFQRTMTAEVEQAFGKELERGARKSKPRTGESSSGRRGLRGRR